MLARRCVFVGFLVRYCKYFQILSVPLENCYWFLSKSVKALVVLTNGMLGMEEEG